MTDNCVSAAKRLGVAFERCVECAGLVVPDNKIVAVVVDWKFGDKPEVFCFCSLTCAVQHGTTFVAASEFTVRRYSTWYLLADRKDGVWIVTDTGRRMLSEETLDAGGYR